MHKLLVFILLLLTSFASYSQLASPLIVRMSDTGTITEIQFALDEGSGKVWLTLNQSGTLGVIQSAPSRATYNRPTEGPALQGKIAGVDDVEFQYYRTNIRGEKAGGIGMVGITEVVYFDRLADPGKQSKVKQIGDLEIDYHNNFYGQQIMGNVAQIGDIKFEYALSPDASQTPRVKEIGNLRFTYVLGFPGDGSNNKILHIKGTEPGVHMQIVHR